MPQAIPPDAQMVARFGAAAVEAGLVTPAIAQSSPDAVLIAEHNWLPYQSALNVELRDTARASLSARTSSRRSPKARAHAGLPASSAARARLPA
jgi:hypothetical protein